MRGRGYLFNYRSYLLFGSFTCLWRGVFGGREVEYEGTRGETDLKPKNKKENEGFVAGLEGDNQKHKYLE